MKRLICLAIAGLLMLAPSAASSTIVVRNDPGGVITKFVKKYTDIKESGEKFVVNGECASACTLFLGILPRSQYCVTSNSRLGFHSASEAYLVGSRLVVAHATEFSALMWNLYPSKVRRVVKNLGWDGDRPEIPHPEIVWVKGKLLRAIAPICTRNDFK